MTRNFWRVIVIVMVLFLWIRGEVAAFHLKVVQEWNQQMLEDDLHDLRIIGAQKEYIWKLQRYIKDNS